jgi:hypothetical protein
MRGPRFLRRDCPFLAVPRQMANNTMRCDYDVSHKVHVSRMFLQCGLWGRLDALQEGVIMFVPDIGCQNTRESLTWRQWIERPKA